MVPPRKPAAVRASRCLVALVLVVLAACSGSGSSRTDGPPGGLATGADRPTIPIVDDVGRTVRVQVPVQRVAAYNAFNVEFIRGVGAFGAIVGIDEGAAGTNYKGYWAGFDTARTVGKGQAEPNYEQLVATRPEVVVFPRNGAWEEAAAKLEPFGIKVIVITGWDLTRHIFNVSLYGVLFDKEAQATKLNAFYTKYRDLLQSVLRDVPRKRVYLENEADFTSPVPGSGWHDMIEAGGGINVFGDIVFGSLTKPKGSVHALAVDPEAVLVRNPELVIKLVGGGFDLASAGNLQAKAKDVLARPGWGGLDAVRNRNLVVTSSFPMNGCSKIIGALYVAKWLHPERMAAVDPDAVMREWVETYQGATLADPSSYALTKLG